MIICDSEEVSCICMHSVLGTYASKDLRSVHMCTNEKAKQEAPQGLCSKEAGAAMLAIACRKDVEAVTFQPQPDDSYYAAWRLMLC